jgi:hypothetical protein
MDTGANQSGIFEWSSPITLDKSRGFNTFLLKPVVFDLPANQPIFFWQMTHITIHRTAGICVVMISFVADASESTTHFVRNSLVEKSIMMKISRRNGVTCNALLAIPPSSSLSFDWSAFYHQHAVDWDAEITESERAVLDGGALLQQLSVQVGCFFSFLLKGIFYHRIVSILHDFLIHLLNILIGSLRAF